MYLILSHRNTGYCDTISFAIGPPTRLMTKFASQSRKRNIIGNELEGYKYSTH